MDIRESIINYSKEIDIEAIGFCSAKDLPNANDELDGAQTFIAILLSYSLKPSNEISDIDSGPKGFFSRASIFEDYHKLVYSRLEKLRDYLINHYNCSAKYYCDISPFSDRSIGVLTGLGAIGKNSFLINKAYGTATYIGYILTDLRVENLSIQPEMDYCGSCTRCIEACPTGAITGDKKVNRERCISQLTQLKDITDEMRERMGNHIYGCDICQRVCPYNQVTGNKKYSAIIPGDYSIKKLLDISNKRFRETIKTTSAGWKGKKILQRNGIIALRQYKNKETVDILAEHISDIRDDIRFEIGKTLMAIDIENSRALLREMVEGEDNQEIKMMINNYLD